ncbi:MAG: flavin reductase family protein [Pseudomonadota bacterium]
MIDQRTFRQALGRFPTGVTVVTTTGPDGPLGITVNSFASVSLDPPLVLWSPARESDRFPAFEAASHFAVHVLAVDQQWIAEGFAQSGDAPFAALEIAEGIGGVPIFEGAVTRLECRHAADHDGGDHLIVVGEVLRITDADRPALAFYCGAYRAL